MTRKPPRLPKVLTDPDQPNYVFNFDTGVVGEESLLRRFCCDLGDHEFLYLAPVTATVSPATAAAVAGRR